MVRCGNAERRQSILLDGGSETAERIPQLNIVDVRQFAGFIGGHLRVKALRRKMMLLPSCTRGVWAANALEIIKANSMV